ncbi:hyaluronate lyase [Streptacidiphilus sp. MAP12-20]|uniref:polysaccharide lyase 8 family protein n=1 Tax=Streptacidiphilus sp. MAP12-20 TaxID=3156299 RepID=UPI00351235D7
MDVTPPLPLASLRRRDLLAAGAAVTGAALLSGGLAAGTARAATTAAANAAAAPDVFDQLRGVWSDILTGGSAVDPADPDYAAAIATVDTAADAAIALYDNSAAPASVYTDLPLTHVENASLSYYRIRDTAIAWATPGSTHHQDAAVAARLVAALALLHTRYYNPAATQVGNWYHWEIASPQAMLNACAVLGGQLPAADLAAYVGTVAHFVPDPTLQQQGSVVTTGANRADKCQITILRGILAKDPALVTLGRDKLSDIFPYVTTSDGFYRDGGYIQHATIPYNGHYAYVLLNDLSQLSLLLIGSPWPITDPGFAVILDAVDLTYAPFMQDGLVMDVVRGRFLSRQGETDHDAGHAITEAILRLIPAGSRDQQKRWKALAKGWITRETFAPIAATATPARMALVKSVLSDPLVRPAAQGPGHIQQPSVERVVHRGEGWAWTVGLSSSRIARLEAINGENQRGWHTGDGATYLYNDDNGHYTDAYWPTVDCTRLPGVTADTLPLALSAGTGTLPSATWSGGARLEGRWGAVGLDLVPFGSPLRAKKSWFCLDDCVVALGADITGRSGHTVETTIENRNLHATGTNGLTVNGTAQPATPGWTAAFPADGWAQLEGVGGYLLLESTSGTTLRAVRESRTGSWAAIDSGPSTGGTTTPYTNTYLTLWLDHGVDPVNAAYAYVLLPGADARQTARRAASPDVTVLANTPALQAIHSSEADLTAANLFAAGSLPPGDAGRPGVTASGPASVLLRRHGDRLTLAASDPTCTQTSLTLTLDGATGYRHGLSDDPGVSIDLSSGTPQITFDLTQGLPGTARTIRLRRG